MGASVTHSSYRIPVQYVKENRTLHQVKQIVGWWIARVLLHFAIPTTVELLWEPLRSVIFCGKQGPEEERSRHKPIEDEAGFHRPLQLVGR